MKKNYLKQAGILLSIPFFMVLFGKPVLVSGQQSANEGIRCGTAQYYAAQVAADPSIELRRQEFEQKLAQWIAAHPGGVPDVSVTIPIVVHIVYNTEAQNVSDERVLEQIAVMNTDYAGLNTHSMWSFSSSLKVNTDIQFCLAKQKPDGTPTNGIERRQTSVAGFTSNNDMKHYSSGGLDAWDVTQYMNIWVCNLTDYLGYAQYPWAGINGNFGLVVRHTAWGLTGAVAPYNLGGTATHEFGHCFTLLHIWGDEPLCTGSDQCGDTPNQADHTFGHHTGVLTDACTSTSPGIMYMNFMDYSDDQDYANFTPNQKTRIQSCFNSGGYLYSLLSSTKCSVITSNLASDVVQTASTDPDWFLFNNQYSHWCAVGVRPNVAGEDWDLHMYADDGFSTTVASSINGSTTPVDFVVMDNNHAPLQVRGIKADRYSGSGSATIEFEGFSETLVVGANNNIDWVAGDVVEMWDIQMQAGTYQFLLSVNSGTANLGFALFGSNGTAYYGGRNLALASADAFGNGQGESFTFTIPTTDYYGLCVWSNNANAANFNLNIGIPGQWLGTVSSNWNTAANWGAGLLPDETMNVNIVGGTPYSPVIENGVTAYCRSLTLENGAILTQNQTSYFYVHGNFNTDLGQFIQNGNSYLYLTGSTFTYWDDDNENDTYRYVRVDKTDPVAVLSMWQNMTVNGNFSVREGIFDIDGTWTLTANNLSGNAFAVEAGGTLRLVQGNVTSNGTMVFQDGSKEEVSGGNIYCATSFTVNSNTTYDIQFTGGNLIMNGTGSQYINDLDGSLELNNLAIQKASGTCYIASNNLVVNGNLNIESGYLSCNNGPSPTAVYNIHVGGNWVNNAGPDAFIESTATVLFDGGNYHQYCSTENFFTLVVNKPLGGAFRVNNSVVSCASYDWTAGAIDVLAGGHFIANDLADNGIAGNFYLNNLGQIDLTNTGGYVDLNGNLYIYGGVFNVHGGSTVSYWPWNANASITMTGGILDFKDQGIRLYPSAYTLTENISGGQIRTAGSLYLYRAGFQPDAGTIVMYGPANATIEQSPGCTPYHLNIDKGGLTPAPEGGVNPLLNACKEGDGYPVVSGGIADGPLLNQVVASTDLDINGDFILTSGVFDPADTLHVGRNWANYAGDAAFLEAGSVVDFDGPTPADILTNEIFDRVVVSKTYSGVEGLEIGTSVRTSGSLKIIDGTVELNTGVNLEVVGDLWIFSGAGLNANDPAPVQIACGFRWFDQNSGFSSTTGFSAGTASVVTFNSLPTGAIQTIREVNPFNKLLIASQAPWVRHDATTQALTCRIMEIQSGEFRLIGNKKLAVTDTIGISGKLSMMDAGDTLVAYNVVWRAGSTDEVMAGKIFVGDDWKFEAGSGAQLDPANLVIFAEGTTTMIVCNDPTVSFGSVLIEKGMGNTNSVYIAASSSDTMRVCGTMTINPGNEFRTQSRNLVVDGLLDIQATAEFELFTGSVTNKAATFTLAGILDVNSGKVLVHGGIEVLSTGLIEISGGSFVSDAPESATWRMFRGSLELSSGRFELTNNSLKFSSSAVTAISGGIIQCGYAFEAGGPGNFQPSGGEVKLTFPGLSSSAYVYCFNGNYFHDLEIAGKYIMGSDLQIMGDLLISAGILNTDNYAISIGGDWTNLVGPAGFEEMTASVVFNSAVQHQQCFGETFHSLRIDKSFGDVVIPTGSVVQCSEYDWVNGGIKVDGGNFTAFDLVDNGLHGHYHLASMGGMITLHQDNGSFIDLNGQVMIEDGTMNVHGGGDDSYWPFGADAEIFMSGGVLDFKDKGVRIWNSAYSLTEDITGGVIRVNGSFHGNRADFNPLGGTVELYGTSPVEISHGNGSNLHHVRVQTLPTAQVSLFCTPAEFMGGLTIEEGVFNLNINELNVIGNVEVMDGGTLLVPGSSRLKMAGLDSLKINSGARLETPPAGGLPAYFEAQLPGGYYFIDVFPGGLISATNASFQGIAGPGLTLHPGSLVDAAGSFTNCSFSDGAAGGTLLTLNNSQDFTIDGASFPVNTWGGASNVTKTVDQGNVFFTNYTGDFAGEVHDQDAYNRIDWDLPLGLAALASPGVICYGATSQLMALVNGGTPPYTFSWSPLEGLSNPGIQNPTASPAATTTYVVTVTDFLGQVVSASALLTVHPLPVADAGADVTIMAGTSTQLNGSGAGGSPPYAFAWSPTTALSDPFAQSPIATPLLSTTYTINVTDVNNCSSTDQVNVTVLPAGSGILNGTVSYDNMGSSSLANVTLSLEQAGLPVYTTLSGAGGSYAFSGVAAGDYTLRCSSTEPWGGVNAADALVVLKHFTGLLTLTGMSLVAGNVDLLPAINSIDALMIAKRFTGLISSFPLGDWAFQSFTVSVGAGGITTQPVKGICYGDANNTYLPPFKSPPQVLLCRQGEVRPSDNGLVDIPLSCSGSLEAGAISLVLDIPASQVEILGVSSARPEAPLLYQQLTETLRIAWYSAKDVGFKPGEAVLTLHARLKDYRGELELKALPESEIADYQGNTIIGSTLYFPTLVAGEGDQAMLRVHPNPFQDQTTLEVRTQGAAGLRGTVYNATGQAMVTFIRQLPLAGLHALVFDGSGLAEGYYTCLIEIQENDTRSYHRVKLMLIR